MTEPRVRVGTSAFTRVVQAGVRAGRDEADREGLKLTNGSVYRILYAALPDMLDALDAEPGDPRCAACRDEGAAYCDTCGTAVATAIAKSQRCRGCSGRGSITRSDDSYSQWSETCRECGGTGKPLAPASTSEVS